MYNKTTDNIERDDEDEDKKNTDAAGNDTENNDDFLRDVHQDGEIKDEDFGATANMAVTPKFSLSRVDQHLVDKRIPMSLQFRKIK